MFEGNDRNQQEKRQQIDWRHLGIQIFSAALQGAAFALGGAAANRVMTTGNKMPEPIELVGVRRVKKVGSSR